MVVVSLRWLVQSGDQLSRLWWRREEAWIGL
jgi:hypothetical protein